MGKKVVLDTNVIISAFGWGGNSRIIMQNILDGKYELVMSGSHLNELIRVLNYPKFGFTRSQQERILNLLTSISIIIDSKENVNVIKEDPSDNVVLEPATEISISYIISGDNHLLNIKQYNGAKIVTPAEFLSLEKIN